mgnify:CR=1 FL=1
MPKKVLIVDDEPISLHILSEFLSDSPFDYDAFQDGRQAFTKLLSSPSDYSVVVMDRIMPYMSGMEILNRMQEDPQLKDIPVIMLTGLGEKEDIIDAVKAGVFDYLTKPIEKILLIKLIERALKGYSGH